MSKPSLSALAHDARQTPAWATYMSTLNWEAKCIDGVYLYRRQIPLFNQSLIKIAHPRQPLPFDQIHNYAQANRTLAIVIEPHIDQYDELAFIDHGYQKSKTQYSYSATIYIDLNQSEKELLNSFSENARRNIKKSLKNNLVIRQVTGSDSQASIAFNEFYQLMANLSQMKKFYMPSHQELSDKFTAFAQQSFIIFAYEQNSRDPVAAIWYVIIDNTLVYLHTGITNRGYELGANYLLVWEGLKIGQSKNLPVFDFESIKDARRPNYMKKWDGYTEFKRRFHGEEVLFPPTWVKFYNPIFKAMYQLGAIFEP